MIDWYYLQVLFITMCFIWGLNYTFKSDEVFGEIGDWGRKTLPDKVILPLYDCVMCMSSVWGTIFYYVFLSSYGWDLWVLFCFALCGLSAIVSSMSEKK